MPLFSITNVCRICTAILATTILGNFSSAGDVDLGEWIAVKKKEDLADIPTPNREFRGVWVATAFNLDWPSKPGLPVHQQKAELEAIFDKAKALKLNAIVLQVRTMCDALYDSPIEPWSYYLTGKIGKPPAPFYDPLKFAVREAHARGLELHAWINPFRSLTGYYGGHVPPDHISKAYPWLSHKNGSHLWLDPSSDFVRNRVLTVAYDLINRYDIDGLHLDDYFYPYPGAGKLEGHINDDDNWNRFLLSEGKGEKADWRRGQVNRLIQELYEEVKQLRPEVKVGISPFGIWKSGSPATVKGLNAHNQIFTDSRKWLREGWVDYFSPQLYWKNEGAQSFPALYEWWQKQNDHNRHIWPGMAPSRIGKEGEGESDGRDAMELLEQITHTREKLENAPASGQLHWHWEAFATNRGGLSRMITKKRYAERALPPASPWLKNKKVKPAKLPVATEIRIVENPAFLDREKRREEIAALEKEKTKNADAEAEKKNAEENLKKAGKAPAESEAEEKILPKFAIQWTSESASDVRWWVVQIQENEGDDPQWEIHDILPSHASVSAIEKLPHAISVQSVNFVGELGQVAAIEQKKNAD